MKIIWYLHWNPVVYVIACYDIMYSIKINLCKQCRWVEIRKEKIMKFNVNFEKITLGSYESVLLGTHWDKVLVLKLRRIDMGKFWKPSGESSYSLFDTTRLKIIPIDKCEKNYFKIPQNHVPSPREPPLPSLGNPHWVLHFGILRHKKSIQSILKPLALFFQCNINKFQSAFRF